MDWLPGRWLRGDCGFRPAATANQGAAAGPDVRPAPGRHKQDAASPMADAQHRHALRQRPRPPRRGRPSARRRARRLPDRDRLRPRRRRARRPGRRRDLRRQGPARVQPADRPRRRTPPPPRRSPTSPGGARARRALLARPAHAGAAAPARHRPLASSPPRASPPWRCAFRRTRWRGGCSRPSPGRSPRPPPTPRAGSARPPRAHVLEGLARPHRRGARRRRLPASGSNRPSSASRPTTPVLLRPGGLPVEEIAAALGRAGRARRAPGITAPGQLASHYAPAARAAARRRRPRARTRSGSASARWTRCAPASTSRPRAISPRPPRTSSPTCARSTPWPPATGAAAIAVAPIPRTGLGLAINDRLARAAAPRP